MNLALILLISGFIILFPIYFFIGQLKPFNRINEGWGIFLWFVTAIITFVIGMNIQVKYEEEISYNDEEHKYFIHSLGNDKYIEGSFGLFTGSINEIDYYFFFVNYVGGMQREKLPISRCYIVEGDYSRPYVSESLHKFNDDDRFWKVWNEYEPYKYTIYVPRNTIVRDFKVR